MANFRFEEAQPSYLRRYRRKTAGVAILALAVLGGSSVGVISSMLPPVDQPLLLNAWRFQTLFLIFVLLAPFLYLYESQFLKYEKYRMYLRYLEAKGIPIDSKRNLHEQLNDPEITRKIREAQNASRSHERQTETEQRITQNEGNLSKIFTDNMLLSLGVDPYIADTAQAAIKEADARSSAHQDPSDVYRSTFDSKRNTGRQRNGRKGRKKLSPRQRNKTMAADSPERNRFPARSSANQYKSRPALNKNQTQLVGARQEQPARIDRPENILDAAKNRSIISMETQFSLFDFERVLKPRTYWMNILALSFLTSIFQILWQWARVWGSSTSQGTVQSHAFTLSNFHGVILVPVMFLAGHRVHKWEAIGCSGALIGAAIMVLDPLSHRVGQKYSYNGSVDMFLLATSIPAALFFGLSKSLMRNRLVPHLLLVNLFTMVGFMVLAVLHEDATFSTHPRKGLFGWVSVQLQLKVILGFGFLSTFWGSAVGYVILMKFFSPIVCMNMLLLEPIFAQLLGCYFGIDHIPGLMTLFGGIFILVGIFFMNQGAKVKQRDKLAYIRFLDYRMQELEKKDGDQLISDLEKMQRELSSIREYRDSHSILPSEGGSRSAEKPASRRRDEGAIPLSPMTPVQEEEDEEAGLGRDQRGTLADLVHQENIRQSIQQKPVRDRSKSPHGRGRSPHERDQRSRSPNYREGRSRSPHSNQKHQREAQSRSKSPRPKKEQVKLGLDEIYNMRPTQQEQLQQRYK